MKKIFLVLVMVTICFCGFAKNDYPIINETNADSPLLLNAQKNQQPKGVVFRGTQKFKNYDINETIYLYPDRTVKIYNGDANAFPGEKLTYVTEGRTHTIKIFLNGEEILKAYISLDSHGQPTSLTCNGKKYIKVDF